MGRERLMRRAVRFGAALAVAFVAIAGPAGPAQADGGPAEPVTAVTSGASATTVTLAPAGPKAAGLVLFSGPVSGPNRTYFARVLAPDGSGIAGAKLEITALTDNPDLRVASTPMYPTKDPTVYGATLTYPADGDWVIGVQVFSPSDRVGLFNDKVTGAGTPDLHSLAANPARRAVVRNNPDFYALYDPYGPLAQGGAVASGLATAAAAPIGTAAGTGSAGHGAVTGATAALHEDGLDPTATLLMVLHTLGAAAWLVAVLGLALANRLGPGHARNELVAWVARHYAVLAGGGLLVLVITGLNNVRDASPGLTTPSDLVQTGTGLAYLGVFAFKMALVAGSAATTWRIHRLLPTPERASARPLLSVGAMADDGPSQRVLKLAEANAVFGGLIIVSVAVLNQLHHVLH